MRVLDSRRSRDDLYQKHCFEDKSFVYVEPEEEEVVSAMNRKQQLQQEAAEAERAKRRSRVLFKRCFHCVENMCESRSAMTTFYV